MRSTYSPPPILHELETYRKVVIENPMTIESTIPGGPWTQRTELRGEIPHRKLRGTASIKFELSKLSTLGVTIQDNSRILMSGGPSKKSVSSLFGKSITLEAGYLFNPDIGVRFNGQVRGCNPSFGQDGEVSLTINAIAVAYEMQRLVVRRPIYYPAVKTEDWDKEASDISAQSGLAYEIYGRAWAIRNPEDPPITLKEIVEGIITQWKFTADVDPFFDKFKFGQDEGEDGAPKVLVQQNETDWQFLQRQAKDYNAYLSENGKTISFKRHESVVGSKEVDTYFVWNSPFGDGSRPHYVDPKEVDLTKPGPRPIWGISPSIDLAFAAPTGAGITQLDAAGNVITVLDDRVMKDAGGFSIESLDTVELKQRLDIYLDDPNDPRVKDDEIIKRLVEELKSWESFEEYKAAGLLRSDWISDGIVGDSDPGESQAYAKYWIPGWSIGFTTFGTPFVMPGDLIQINNLATFLEGGWLVNTVNHVFGADNSWTTSYTVARGTPVQTQIRSL